MKNDGFLVPRSILGRLARYRKVFPTILFIFMTVLLITNLLAAGTHPVTAASAIMMGETNILGQRDTGKGNELSAQQVSLSQPATLQSLSFYVTNVEGRLQLGLYDDAGGSPRNLLAASEVFTPAAGWNTVNVPALALAPGNYWLAFLPESNKLSFAIQHSGSARWFNDAFGSLPAAFSSSPKKGADHWSFYATLTANTVPLASLTNTATAAPLPSLTPSANPTDTPTAAPLPSLTPTANPTNPALPTSSPTASITVAPTNGPTSTAGPLPTSTTVSQISIGETNILSQTDNGNGGLLVAQQVTLNQQATLQSLSFYVTNASGRLQLGIYADSGGNPSNLLATSAVFTPAAGWNTASVSPISLAPGTYWLAYLPESSSLSFAMQSSGQARWFSTAFGSLPAAFSASPNSGSYHWSFYGTLIVNTNASVTPTSTAVPTSIPSPAPTVIPTNTPVVTPGPSPTPTATAGLDGMLRVDPANPRYFTDGSGKAILLVGDHTWNTLVDNGPSNPPTAFDYPTFLSFLRSHGINFFRMFAWEQTQWSEGTTSPWYYSPAPFARTGPGTALDGLPRFDLTQFNQAYFDRLRQRVQAANQLGIYVSLQLFDSFSVENKGYPSSSNNPWPGHPFNLSNNRNGINGDTNHNGQGEDTETLADPTVTALQEAYVRKVIDTVNDLNVLYEICNEADGGAAQVAWENHMIDLIHSYEAGKPYQHPVGYTVQWPGGSNADLFASHADWVSPNGDINTPLVGTGSKVVINDTDHIAYPAGDRVWAWKSFTNGLHPAFMDPYDCAAEWSPSGCSPTNLTWVSLRQNLGYILAYARRINLQSMVPSGSLSSSGYALAYPNPTTGEYLVYLPAGGAVTVDLSGTSGTLSVEWFNPGSGATTNGGTTSGGGSRSFTAPFGGDAVLYLHH